MKALERSNLLREKASVEKLLANLSPYDYAGKIALEERQLIIQEKLESLDGPIDTLASVVLVFGGEPVVGDRSINVEFASKILDSYQEIISKKLAYSEAGGLARRGPVPIKRLSGLNITNVVHGSFGFLLEEDDSEGPELVNSSLKVTVEDVTEDLKIFTGADDHVFYEKIDSIDSRIFTSFGRFFKNLYDYKAVFKVVENRGDISFDKESIDRAFLRTDQKQIEEQDVIIEAILLGVVPFQRRFDARVVETGEMLSGRIGPTISEEYLHRISDDEQVIGRKYHMSVHKKELRKPDGRVHKSVILLSLNES